MLLLWIKGSFIPIILPNLNPICHLLALLGAHHILHVSRIRVNISNLAVRTQHIVPIYCTQSEILLLEVLILTWICLTRGYCIPRSRTCKSQIMSRVLRHKAAAMRAHNVLQRTAAAMRAHNVLQGTEEQLR
jgi:hypothetical protein